LSIQAVAWALTQQIVTSHSTRFVLVSLANHAGESGTGAFPSIDTIGAETGLSRRTIQTCLRELADAGLIERGNQGLAAAYIEREDRRPVVYDLLMPAPEPMAKREPRQKTELRKQASEDMQKLMDRRTAYPCWRSFRDPIPGENVDAYRDAQEQVWKEWEARHAKPKFEQPENRLG
jgi:hypothetical protein